MFVKEPVPAVSSNYRTGNISVVSFEQKERDRCTDKANSDMQER
jgi:hypothetical protein